MFFFYFKNVNNTIDVQKMIVQLMDIRHKIERAGDLSLKDVQRESKPVEGDND